MWQTMITTFSRRADNRNELRALLAVAAAAGLLAGCGATQRAPDDAVAIFDGGWVTEAEVAQASEGSAVMPSRLASRRDAGPDEVARWIAWEKLVAKQRRSEVERRRLFALRVQELERQPLVSRLHAELAAAVEVSDADIDAEIATIRAQREANQPRLEIRTIFLRASDDVPEAERQRKLALAQRLRAELQHGASFEELARSYSESSTAPNGGLIPGVRPGMTDPVFEKVVFALDEGEISDVIETASGYHIVRVDRRTGPEPVNEDALRKSLPDVLRQRRSEQATAELVERLRQTEPVVARWSTDGVVDPRPGDGAILVVDDFVYTADDLGEARARAGVLLQRRDQVRDLLDGLLERELLYREALRRFEPTRRDLRELHERASNTVLVELALRDEEAELVAGIPRAALEEFVDELGDQLRVAVAYRPQVIFLPDGTNVWETFRTAERLVAELRAGADFAELADQRSKGANADTGGDLGLLTTDDMMAYDIELLNTVNALEVGEVSDPVRIPEKRLSSQPGSLEGGFLIVKLLDRREARALDLATDEDQLRRRYWAVHRAELLEQRRDEMLLGAGFRVVESATPTPAEDSSSGSER